MAGNACTPKFPQDPTSPIIVTNDKRAQLLNGENVTDSIYFS